MNPVIRLQKCGVILAKVIPLKCADTIAAGIGLLYCYFSKKKREYIIDNLKHIFHDTSIAKEQLNMYVKNTFVNFAKAMVDFFRLSFMTKDEFDVEFGDSMNVCKALSYGRGCVLLTLHLGNWDAAGAYLAAHDYPMNALVEETEAEMFEMYTAHRERTGMKTFPVTRAGYAFLDAMRNNRILAVLADRDIVKNGVAVKFFSGKRYIPKGLADIIVKKQIPVIFGYMVFNPSQKKHRYLGIIEEPMFFKETVDEFNATMVGKFESFIRKYPDQWFVFHPEWVE